MFTTKEEVDFYLSGDKVTCLECGKAFRNLGLHLYPRHRMTATDYKLKHGIPLCEGLMGRATKAGFASRCKSQHENGNLSPDAMQAYRKENPERFLAAIRTRNAHPPAWLGALKSGIAKRQDIPEWVIEEFLFRVASGRKPSSVEKDHDMPLAGVFYYRAKNDSEFSRRFEAAKKEGKEIRDAENADRKKARLRNYGMVRVRSRDSSRLL